MMALDEVVVAIACESGGQSKSRSLLHVVVTAPRIEFVSERLRGCTQEQIAHRRTGRNIRTGKLHLGVSLRRRNNGMTRIQADLWKLDYNLSDGVQELLRGYWRTQNEGTPARLLKRMERHFGKTHVCFDVVTEQVKDWRGFLSTVLTDRESYVSLELSAISNQVAGSFQPIPALER